MKKVLFFVFGVLLTSTFASAQSLNANRFTPVSDAGGLIATDTGEINSVGKFNLNFALNYMKNPLIFVDENGDKINDDLVTYRLDGSLWGSVGIASWFQAGLIMPIIFVQNGNTGINKGEQEELPQGGIGDIVVVPKFRILSQNKYPVAISLIPAITLPTGDEKNYQGENTVTFSPKFALSRKFPFGMFLAVNLFYTLRENVDLGESALKDELGYNVALAYDLPVASVRRMTISGELLGGFAVSEPFKKQEESPLEGLLGFSYVSKMGIGAKVGAGGGILPGIGTPTFRFLAGVFFSSDESFAPTFSPLDDEVEE